MPLASQAAPARHPPSPAPSPHSDITALLLPSLSATWKQSASLILHPPSPLPFLRSLLLYGLRATLDLPHTLLIVSTNAVAIVALLLIFNLFIFASACMRRGDNDPHPTLYTQAALRLTPPLLLCILLAAIVQGPEDEQQQWWTQGTMTVACNIIKVLIVLATAVGLSADISNHLTETEAAKAKRQMYHSRRQRVHVLIKVPGFDVPANMHAELQYRVEMLWPLMQCHRLSVRQGCIIVELDLAGRASDSADASACGRTAAEWLETLKLDSLDGLADGQVVSVQIDGKLSLMRFSQASRQWSVVSEGAPSPFLQLKSHCLTLGAQPARIAMDLSGLVGLGVEFEAVSGGRHQPCSLVPGGAGAGEGVQTLEVDLSSAGPGLMRCNVWSKPSVSQPTSRLLATASVLLLPEECAAAAAELAKVAARSQPAMMLDMYSDLGELLEATAEAVPESPGDYVLELAGSAADLMAWCQKAGCAALGLLVSERAQLLRQTGGDVAAKAPAGVQKLPSGPAAVSGPRTSRSVVGSLLAAVRRLDIAMPAGYAELRSWSLPSKLWAMLVLAKCTAASMRSLTSGAGLPELVPLALWGLPYAFILASHSAGAGGSAATGPLRRLSLWLARNSRPCLHVYRSLLVALMGLGYLATPFVFKITSSGVDLPAKALYMVTEAYDCRLAILCILLVDLPAFYVLYSRLQVPYVAAHLAVLGLLGMVVQLGMEGWRARCEQHSRLQASAKKNA